MSSARRGGGLAALLSLVLPGLGHATFGHGRRGALWMAGVFVAWAVPAMLAGFWLGALAVALALAGVAWIVCAVDAYRQPRESATLRGFIALVIAVVLASTIGEVAVALVIRTTALEAFKVPSGSMCPAVEVGDHVYVDKTAYKHDRIRPGDIVVHRTKSPSGADIDFVRRVVAVGGDEVSVDEQGHVTVRGRAAELKSLGRTGCNGAEIYEEKLDGESATHFVAFEASALGPPAVTVRVPEGELYLLGDNRMNSHDSRVTGPAKVDTVIGRVWKIWLRGSSLTWQSVR